MNADSSCDDLQGGNLQDYANSGSKTVREVFFDAQNINKNFGTTHALKDISIRLSRTEKTAIIGPSGAGKTSLLKILSGAMVPSSGGIVSQVRFQEPESAFKKDSVRPDIAFIPQDFGLTPSLSVVQNIACGRLGKLGFWRGARAVLFPKKDELESIYRLLQQLGIEDMLYQPVAKLSGGEAQRVAIGRALYQQADCLFADEPVASLDPERAASLLTLLTRLCEEQKLLLCVSLHNLELARKFFDRLIGLRDGEIIFDAPPSQITSADLKRLYSLKSASVVCGSDTMVGDTTAGDGCISDYLVDDRGAKHVAK